MISLGLGDLPPLRQQYAALPFRVIDGDAIRVLLITSRRTRRWVLPKGWQKRNATPAATAAREAFEEAGVHGGAVTPSELGAYHYAKRLDDGSCAPCRVGVFALEARLLAETWPEKGQRSLRWCAPGQAAHLVEEPELAAILARFTPPRGRS